LARAAAASGESMPRSFRSQEEEPAEEEEDEPFLLLLEMGAGWAASILTRRGFGAAAAAGAELDPRPMRMPRDFPPLPPPLPLSSWGATQNLAPSSSSLSSGSSVTGKMRTSPLTPCGAPKVATSTRSEGGAAEEVEGGDDGVDEEPSSSSSISMASLAAAPRAVEEGLECDFLPVTLEVL